MKNRLFILLLGLVFAGQAQQDSTELVNLNLFDLSLEQLLDVEVKDDNPFSLYGYINANIEKVFNLPTLDSTGNTYTEDLPVEWSPVRNFHLYGAGKISPRINILFNLAAPDGEFELRNAYGNFLIKDYLQLRVGKMYRRFGLYNEKLDQIPTFAGIEAPELFDNDHLFLPRTTNLMLHGNIGLREGKILYAVNTGNPESGAQKKVAPLGWDIRYKSKGKGVILGFSGYYSSITNEKTSPGHGNQQGISTGGVLPWMEGDNYKISGAYIEKKFVQLLIQCAYWVSAHDATRNQETTLRWLRSADLSNDQLEHFLYEYDANTELTADNMRKEVSFIAQTAYLRLSYLIDTKNGQFIPYLFFDWISNPEMIYSSRWGGDQEVGLANNGQFYKPSLGISYRPVETVAIKLDGSFHIQEFNGNTIAYPEIRLDFSFAFDGLKKLK